VEVSEEVLRSNDGERAEEKRMGNGVEGRVDEAEGGGVRKTDVVGFERRGRGVVVEVELQDLGDELGRDGRHVEGRGQVVVRGRSGIEVLFVAITSQTWI
jgi:hypothetical protein